MNYGRFDSLMLNMSNRNIVVHKMILLNHFGFHHDGVFFILMIFMSDMVIGMIN